MKLRAVLGVPGVRGAVVFDRAGQGQSHGDTRGLSKEALGALRRGISNALERHAGGLARGLLTLRFERGRAFCSGMPDGGLMVVVSDADVHVPLLQVTLEGVDERPRPPAPPDDSGARLTMRAAVHVSPTLAPDAFSVPTIVPVSVVRADQLCAAMSQLSATAATYFGKHVIANYWRVTRPAAPLPLRLTEASAFAFEGEYDAVLDVPTVDAARAWTNAFLARCARVVPQISAEAAGRLDPAGQKLLGLEVAS